jgi:sugar phosphate isomerase/epimerase
MKHKNVILLLLAAVVIGCCVSPLQAQDRRRGRGRGYRMSTDAYDGWRLGTQAYSFNRFTFFEAVDKTASLGLDWIEAYPGQRLSEDHADVKTDHNMSAEMQEVMKAKLRDAGVRLINYGVVGLSKDEKASRKVFDFAKAMGIRTIVSEPPEDAFDTIDKLCQEYEIQVAIHNHPKPSRYWNPETVLKVCEGRSKWIGACADTGHWVRSGLDPVECLKKLDGKILSSHFKELQDGHDVPWGQGPGRAKPLLEEFNRQGYRGSFSIEYEYNWMNSVPEIRQCVAYYNKVAGAMNPNGEGWKDLLAADLSNCNLKDGGWVVEEGVLGRKGGGYVWTKEQYGDFILDLEFKNAPKTNSGVFIRTANVKDPVQTGIEIQIADSYGQQPNRNNCGAVYDCLAPSRQVVKKAGEWNHMTILCVGGRIRISMNGERIISMDMDKWTEARVNPPVEEGGEPTKNKFKTAYKDMARSGAIGFQDHGHPVWYRNIKVRKIDVSMWSTRRR